MKDFIKKLCSPVLNIFEQGEGQYTYKKSHRTVLIVVGFLFLVVSAISIAASIASQQFGGVIPIAVFFTAGVVCEIVGLLGSDAAVARIWKSK